MKVFFDANYSIYHAKAIGLLERAKGEIEVIVTDEALYEGASDEEVIKLVAKTRVFFLPKMKISEKFN